MKKYLAKKGVKELSIWSFYYILCFCMIDHVIICPNWIEAVAHIIKI